MNHRLRYLLVAVAGSALAACGGGGGDSSSVAPAPPAGTDARVTAASATARSNPMCTEAVLGPYYWEVGDANGVLASGSSSSAAPIATTAMWVFSASKWLYAANVVQKRGVQASDVPYLNFTSGYSEFGNSPFCLPNANTTVQGCLAGRDGFDPTTVGRFDYDSGHMQRHAATVMGLGSADNAALAADLNATVGNFGFTYIQPQPAAGVVATPQAYGQFLRRMLRGELALGAALGSNKVCTDASVCSSAVPDVVRPEAWDYSLGHWVEDDPRVGDRAYSSPGGGGFYPWIDAGKTYYGVLARDDVTRDRTIEGDAGYHSAQCGRLIRQAFVTAQQVTATEPTPVR